MKVKNWFVTAFCTLFAPVLSAHEFGGKAEMISWNQGSFLIQDSSDGLKIGLDYTDNVKAINLFIDPNGNIHHFSIGFFSRKDGIRESFAGRGKYKLALPVVYGQYWRFSSESSFASGFLDAKYLTQKGDPRFEFREVMFGFSQYFINHLKSRDVVVTLKVGGELTGSTLSDDYGSLTEWDNYGFGFRSDISARLADSVKFQIEADALRKRYNPERYFFVEKWTNEFEVRSALVLSPHRKWDVIPSFNYKLVDIERDRRLDLKRPEFGATVVRKNVLKNGWNVFAKGLYAPWQHKRGQESILSFGVYSSTMSLELYRKDVRDEYSMFVLKDTLIGFQLAWKFNAFDNGLKDVDDYGTGLKNKYEFYRESSRQDNTALTRVQQAERLRTLRKQNEWTYNLSWTEEMFWDTDAVYQKRSGDCDQQQCLNNTMHTQNGYRAYLPAWWDFNRSFVGHATGVIQDPTTGEWFWQEYGMLAKVRNVNASSTVKQVVSEALKQNHRFSALPLNIKNTQGVDYTIIDCNSPQTYQWLTGFIPLGNVPYQWVRPNIEYGYELFTKRNFLFDY